MAGQTDYSAAVGVFKDSWENEIIETYAGDAPILADAKMEGRELNGGLYHRTTRLTLSGGQTFAPASTGGVSVLPGDGGRAYVGPRAGQSPDAQLAGMQIHGRSRVTYEAIARSSASVNGGANNKKAVREATKVELDGLMMGTIKKAEALMLHGGEGIGQLDGAGACSNVVAAVANPFDGGTTGFAVDLRISQQSWAEALWLAFESHTFDLFANASGLPTGAKLNTAVNTVLNGANQNGYVLIAIQPPTPLLNGPTDTSRVLRLWHTSGTAGVAGTGVIGGWTTSATPDQHIVFESAGVGTEFSGLGLMSSNAGTLFGISALQYSMMRGNDITGVGTVKLAEIIRYSARAINAGAKGKRMRAVVPTEAFAQFANDEATLRRYAAETTTGKGGMHNLECYLPMGGVLEVLGHNLQKDGRIYIYPPEELVRVGAQEIDFVSRAGGASRGSDRFILEVAQQPTREVRLYGQFAPMVDCPRHCVRLTGVTY